MFTRLASSPLVRNTGWMAAGQGVNFFLQAAYFLLVARLLGVVEYGVFVGAFALVNSVTPYTSLGSTMIFMRYVSVDRSQAPAYWGNTLVITATASLVCAAVLGLTSGAILGHASLVLVLTLVVANCFTSQLVVNASMVFQTFEQLKITAWLRTMSNLLRVIAIAVLLLGLHHATALECSIGLLIASSIGALVAGLQVRLAIGQTSVSMPLFRRRFFEGIGFAVAGSSQSLYNDVDKIMLDHYGMHAANGIYTMAYRVVDFATTPVLAVDSATLPRMFALSKSNDYAVLALARKAIPVAALAGLAAGLGALIGSPWITRLAGPGFLQSIGAIRWLCWLPALRGVHQLAGGMLTATGRQNWRTVAQLLIAGLNFVLNILWIPAHGWHGAAWASLISDGALSVINVLLVLLLFRNCTSPILAAESEEAL
jgi:O-antigen/teichoic acid export membrane protein